MCARVLCSRRGREAAGEKRGGSRFRFFFSPPKTVFLILIGSLDSYRHFLQRTFGLLDPTKAFYNSKQTNVKAPAGTGSGVGEGKESCERSNKKCQVNLCLQAKLKKIRERITFLCCFKVSLAVVECDPCLLFLLKYLFRGQERTRESEGGGVFLIFF